MPGADPARRKGCERPRQPSLLLRDRLTQLHKETEIKLFPDREHSIGPEVNDLTVDFFRRKLAPIAPAAEHG
jgi:hypothetical protein